jgi:hypothetical protein
MAHRIKYPRARLFPRAAATKAGWVGKLKWGAPRLPDFRPFAVIAAVAARWLSGRHVGGNLAKALRGAVAVYAPSAPVPGAFSFLLRSIKRPWGSKLTIGIRLKW